MSPMSNEELRRSRAELLALVEKGPKPSREAIEIAEMLLNTLSDGFKPESRAARLGRLLRGQFLAWFGEDQVPNLDAARRQKIAMLGGIGQLVDLAARQRTKLDMQAARTAKKGPERAPK
jgi:hypothetical protein